MRVAVLAAVATLGLLAAAAAAPAGAGGCPATLAGRLASTRGAEQLVTVVAPRYRTTRAALTVWARRGGCWRRVAGPWGARVGWNGLSDRKREGDGTTPTGAYRIGSTVYGIAPDPGVRGRYRRLVCGDWWDEDPASPAYNRFRRLPCGAAPPFGGDSEALWRATAAYGHFAVIEYNTHPVVPGRGSAIFLHESDGRATTGCISLPARQLVRVLRWLDPHSRPLIAIGTRTEIRSF